MKYPNPNVVRVLTTTRHNWCLENNIWYDLEYSHKDNIYDMHDSPYYFIVFKDKADAMLFKLT
jgi:hypothetical protein